MIRKDGSGCLLRPVREHHRVEPVECCRLILTTTMSRVAWGSGTSRTSKGDAAGSVPTTAAFMVMLPLLELWGGRVGSLEYGAGVGAIDSGDDPHQGGFARAVLADDPERLSGVSEQIDAVDVPGDRG